MTLEMERSEIYDIIRKSGGGCFPSDDQQPEANPLTPWTRVAVPSNAPQEIYWGPNKYPSSP